jgi:uncharacterized protein (TIGR03435 family)
MLIGTGLMCVGQTSIESLPAFEVASVKPNRSTGVQIVGDEALPGGRYKANNLSLRWLISEAYGLPILSSRRLMGGPDWINSEKYDIDAKAVAGSVPAGLSEQARRERAMLMLRALLRDRFQLKIHRETREQAIFALAVAKNGPHLQPAKMQERDCPEVSSFDVSCHHFAAAPTGGLHGKSVDMTDLARWLETVSTDRPVVDKTGLKGLFDIDVDGDGLMVNFRRPRGEMGAVESGPPDAPESGLFSILDHLGLKLETAKGPVEIVVIDHVERPTEN